MKKSYINDIVQQTKFSLAARVIMIVSEQRPLTYSAK